jgi:hypothetical protein
MEQFLRTTLNCDMSRTERGTVCVCVCANEQASKHFVCVCVCVRLPGVEQRCTFRIEGRDTPQPQGIIMQCKYAWCNPSCMQTSMRYSHRRQKSFQDHLPYHYCRRCTFFKKQKGGIPPHKLEQCIAPSESKGGIPPQPQVVCRPVYGTALGARKVSKTMHLLKKKKEGIPPHEPEQCITTQAKGRLSNKFYC